MKKTIFVLALVCLLFVTIPTTQAGTNATINIRAGDVRGTEYEPDLIAYANIENTPPPEGVTITSSPYLWRLGNYVALMEKDEFIQATFSGTNTTKLGVQLWGDGNDGWARVRVDGESLWTGNVYNSIMYLEISDLDPGSHTIRVECMGIKGYEMGGDDVAMLFFGFEDPDQFFSLEPDTLWMTAHDTAAGPLTTKTNDPSATDTELEVNLTAHDPAEVDWSSTGDSWIQTFPFAGTTPSTISVSAALFDQDVEHYEYRVGEEVYESDDGTLQKKLKVNLTIAPPRYIEPGDVNPPQGVKSEFFSFLASRGYTSVEPTQASFPPGTVLLWKKVGDPSGYIAHSTIVFDYNLNTIGMERINKIIQHPTIPTAGGLIYELAAVWEPPNPILFDRHRVPSVLLIEGEVERESGMLRRWNCHGFVLNVLWLAIEDNTIIKEGSDVEIGEESLTINSGEVWFEGDEGQTIIAPPGEFTVHSQGLVNVAGDMTTTFYLFEGTADYSGGGYNAHLEALQKVVISPSGEPGPVESFDPEEIEKWWQEINVEPGTPPPDMYLPLVLYKASGG
jgi:hypothetical protein